MSVDERSRHRLYQKLEEVLGAEEAGILMSHLPPTGWSEVATKTDLRNGLESLEYRLTARMEQLARRMVMWTSSLVIAAVALAFAAGRFV